MLSHAYDIIINCTIGSPVYYIEVVGGLNAIDKNSINVNGQSIIYRFKGLSQVNP